MVYNQKIEKFNLIRTVTILTPDPLYKEQIERLEDYLARGCFAWFRLKNDGGDSQSYIIYNISIKDAQYMCGMYRFQSCAFLAITSLMGDPFINENVDIVAQIKEHKLELEKIIGRKNLGEKEIDRRLNNCLNPQLTGSSHYYNRGTLYGEIRHPK